MTPQDIELVLEALGWEKRPVPGESLFVKTVQDRIILNWLSFNAGQASDSSRSSQRLLVSPFVSTEAYAKAQIEITGRTFGAENIVMGPIAQRDLGGDGLEAALIGAAVAQVEHDALGFDVAAKLAEFRQFDPSRPGVAGVRHITALALAGDTDTLERYISRRRLSDPCGFVSFISDDMIARAAEIARRNG